MEVKLVKKKYHGELLEYFVKFHETIYLGSGSGRDFYLSLKSKTVLVMISKGGYFSFNGYKSSTINENDYSYLMEAYEQAKKLLLLL